MIYRALRQWCGVAAAVSIISVSLIVTSGLEHSRTLTSLKKVYKGMNERSSSQEPVVTTLQDYSDGVQVSIVHFSESSSETARLMYEAHEVARLPIRQIGSGCIILWTGVERVENRVCISASWRAVTEDSDGYVKPDYSAAVFQKTARWFKLAVPANGSSSLEPTSALRSLAISRDDDLYLVFREPR